MHTTPEVLSSKAWKMFKGYTGAWRARRFRWIVVAGGLGLLLLTLSSPGAATSTPVLTAVTFSGSAANPQITIDGSQFGSEPAPTNAGYPGYTGYDYGNALYFCDTSTNPSSWCAGQNDGRGNGADTIGLVISSYTDTHIVYTLGSDYGSYYYPSDIFRAEPGDQFTVHVNGATCAGTINYSGQPKSCTTTPTAPSTPTANPTPLPPSTTLPQPVLGKTVDITPMSGRVLVRPAGFAKGRPFTLLTKPRQLPIGSEVDARRGFVSLYTAGASRNLKSGSFGFASFQIVQSRQAHAVTGLRLTNSPIRICGRPRNARVARRRQSHRVLGLLHAQAHGRFRTYGRYSAASVRGTDWDVIERCDGTLTVVLRGAVTVFDFRLRRQVIVHAGQLYFAKAQ